MRLSIHVSRVEQASLVAACLALIGTLGCGGGAGTKDGAPIDAPADLAPGGAGGVGGAGGTTGGAGGTGAPADGGADARDCFPECVAALRRSCPRPAFAEGSCIQQGEANGGSVICYSNGVRETRGPTIDGGLTAEFTQPDGQTLCYVVVVVGGGQSFRTPDGREVARLVSTTTGSFDVTCAGSTTVVTVDINDPACRMLNSGDCTIGTCP